jgi:hypothetical protein
MDPVTEVDIESPGGPERHRVAGGKATVSVGRGVRPGPVRHSAVRLDLDYDCTNVSPDEGGTQESMRSRNWVNQQLFCAHPIDTALAMADARASQRFWGRATR